MQSKRTESEQYNYTIEQFNLLINNIESGKMSEEEMSALLSLVPIEIASEPSMIANLFYLQGLIHEKKDRVVKAQPFFYQARKFYYNACRMIPLDVNSMLQLIHMDSDKIKCASTNETKKLSDLLSQFVNRMLTEAPQFEAAHIEVIQTFIKFCAIKDHQELIKKINLKLREIIEPCSLEKAKETANLIDTWLSIYKLLEDYSSQELSSNNQDKFCQLVSDIYDECDKAFSGHNQLFSCHLDLSYLITAIYALPCKNPDKYTVLYERTGTFLFRMPDYLHKNSETRRMLSAYFLLLACSTTNPSMNRICAAVLIDMMQSRGYSNVTTDTMTSDISIEFLIRTYPDELSRLLLGHDQYPPSLIIEYLENMHVTNMAARKAWVILCEAFADTYHEKQHYVQAFEWYCRVSKHSYAAEIKAHNMLVLSQGIQPTNNGIKICLTRLVTLIKDGYVDAAEIFKQGLPEFEDPHLNAHAKYCQARYYAHQGMDPIKIITLCLDAYPNLNLSDSKEIDFHSFISTLLLELSTNIDKFNEQDYPKLLELIKRLHTTVATIAIRESIKLIYLLALKYYFEASNYLKELIKNIDDNNIYAPHANYYLGLWYIEKSGNASSDERDSMLNQSMSCLAYAYGKMYYLYEGINQEDPNHPSVISYLNSLVSLPAPNIEWRARYTLSQLYLGVIGDKELAYNYMFAKRFPNTELDHLAMSFILDARKRADLPIHHLVNFLSYSADFFAIEENRHHIPLILADIINCNHPVVIFARILKHTIYCMHLEYTTVIDLLENNYTSDVLNKKEIATILFAMVSDENLFKWVKNRYLTRLLNLIHSDADAASILLPTRYATLISRNMLIDIIKEHQNNPEFCKKIVSIPVPELHSKSVFTFTACFFTNKTAANEFIHQIPFVEPVQNSLFAHYHSILQGIIQESLTNLIKQLASASSNTGFISWIPNTDLVKKQRDFLQDILRQIKDINNEDEEGIQKLKQMMAYLLGDGSEKKSQTEFYVLFKNTSLYNVLSLFHNQLNHPQYALRQGRIMLEK